MIAALILAEKCEKNESIQNELNKTFGATLREKECVYNTCTSGKRVQILLDY